MNLEEDIDDFIICPIRNQTESERLFLTHYISSLELEGYKVYWPFRDTNQQDNIGLNICYQNRNAIKKAKRVRVYFTSKSEGTLFDIGMSFMARKPIIVINHKELEFKKDKDEFKDFILKYAINTNFYGTSEFYNKVLKRREEIKELKIIEYEWKGNTREFLFDFGMTFMAGKEIILKNRDDVRKSITPYKSFQNLLFTLDSLNRIKRKIKS